MNDKNRQRHIAYEVLVILGQLALLTCITRLWPILLLVILGIFVAALRLLFLSSQKVEPVRPLPTLSPPRQPPTEKDLQSAAYTISNAGLRRSSGPNFRKSDGSGRIHAPWKIFWQAILPMCF